MEPGHLSRNIRFQLFKIINWFELIFSMWSFMRDEWKESWETYGLMFAFGDYASKLEYWAENGQAIGKLIEKRASSKKQKSFFLH
jgi:hypothetical protein